MGYTVKEVLQFVSGNNVKFVRLTFFDITGIKKSLSIMSQDLKAAFEQGVPLPSGRISGLGEGADSGLLLFPDPDTLKLLSWRQYRGAVVSLMCRLCSRDGKSFGKDVRSVLKKAVLKAESLGFEISAALDEQFYLFRLNDLGQPTNQPLDYGGYMDTPPADRCESIRRRICLAMEEMEIIPAGAFHGSGWGQNELRFRASALPGAVDDHYTFQTAAKETAAANGACASFAVQPLSDQFCSRVKITLHVKRYGENIFQCPGGKLTAEAQSFTAGILKCLQETAIYYAPSPESYESLSEFRAGWSWGRGDTAVRLLLTGDDRSGLVFSPAETGCNLYLLLTLLICAGLDAIGNDMALGSEYGTPEAEVLTMPENLAKACIAAESSELIRRFLPRSLAGEYLAWRKKAEPSQEDPEEIPEQLLSE